MSFERGIKMKLAIIADDITGANDSGVQLAKYGLNTSVLFDLDKKGVENKEAVVFDTDSRAVEKDEAYRLVKEASVFLKGNGFNHIYKKIDSTMRGNIGAEIDAVYDVINPDFMLIVPGYPKNGRVVKEGYHYLNGKLLHETEIGTDPKTPVKESYLPDLLSKQTNQSIGIITSKLLSSGEEAIKERLMQFKKNNISYVIVDSETEKDLENILHYVSKTEFNVGWVGSAGLANYLPSYYDIERKGLTYNVPKSERHVLTVVGSVNVNSRMQLEKLLEQKNVKGVPFESVKAVSEKSQRDVEVERVYLDAKRYVQEGKHIVIYSTGETEDIKEAQEFGREKGLTHTQVGTAIVNALGEVSAKLLDEGFFEGIVMTGGDTAKQIAKFLNIKGFELFDELEIGIPLGTFVGYKEIYTVTKAGGFGSENVFMNSIIKLQGEEK